MALTYLLVNEATGKNKRGTTPELIIDEDYDVGGGGQVIFVVSQTFTAASKIDVWVNGRKQREGASYDFTRNVGLNRIEFTYTVAENAWVEVRVFL